MKKLLVLTLTLSGATQIYSSQVAESRSSSSSSSGVASVVVVAEPKTVALRGSRAQTATQGIEILQKLDKYLKADAVKRFMGKRAHDYLQEERLKTGDETALKFLYIRKHLVELIPAVMPYPCIDMLHYALARSLKIVEGKNATQIALVEDDQNQQFKEADLERGRLVLNEDSHAIIIHRWWASLKQNPYSQPVISFDSDLKKGICAYYDRFVKELELPRFDEGRKEYISLIWVHPARLNQLLNCTMEQLELMADLYHTQDPRIQKNRKRAIILDDQQRGIFNGLPEQLQKNLKVQYPVVTSSTEKMVYSLYLFYRAHKIKIICGLVLAGSLFSYCKWFRKSVTVQE